jgi:hypothetical protein
MVLLLLAQQYRKRYGYARSTRTTTRSSRQVPDARECGAQPLAARKLDEDLWLAPWQQCSQRIWYLVVFTPDRRQRSGGGFSTNRDAERSAIKLEQQAAPGDRCRRIARQAHESSTPCRRR